VSISFTERYLEQTAAIARTLDPVAIDKLVRALVAVRERRGRLFVIGVGGGAGHASHAVNDFRKIAGIEAYTPVDNVSELTARINDDGWDSAFSNWLKTSRLGPADLVMVFSVGGGDLERGISVSLVRALEYARSVGTAICGIVGRDGGFTARVADACVVVPTVDAALVTAHTEAFQAVVWHLLVAHPELQATPMKWESVR
jgi:D-sedoheptulose 7-phosphate isomerase